MGYAVELLKQADKYLDKLARQQPKDAAAIESAIDSLAAQPHPPSCRPLRGFPGVLRCRVGQYRICYRVDDDELVVLVITISTRDDVYEVLRRRLHD